MTQITLSLHPAVAKAKGSSEVPLKSLTECKKRMFTEFHGLVSWLALEVTFLATDGSKVTLQRGSIKQGHTYGHMPRLASLSTRSNFLFSLYFSTFQSPLNSQQFPNPSKEFSPI